VPNQLTLTVGTNTATIPLAGSNAKINAVIVRYLNHHDIVTEGLTPTQVGEAFLLHLKAHVVAIGTQVQGSQLRGANEVIIQATLQSDNAL
jgi:hypothetical protein